jgi:hypothetical protein
MTKAMLAVTAMLAIHATRLDAQGMRRVERGDRFIGAFAAASVYMDGGARFAELRERNMFATSLRAEWVLESAGPLAISSTIELVPMALISRRAGSIRDCWVEPNGRSHCQTASGEPTYGSGLFPFGLKLYALNGATARLFATGSTGLMMFSRDMPVVGSRRLNFAIEYGVGVEVGAVSGRVIALGWKFHHMSNAYTAQENPGLDLNMFYLGLLHRRR